MIPGVGLWGDVQVRGGTHHEGDVSGMGPRDYSQGPGGAHSQGDAQGVHIPADVHDEEDVQVLYGSVGHWTTDPQPYKLHMEV